MANAQTIRTGAPSFSSSRPALLPAILTGQAAGLIMAVAVMGVFALVFGKNPLYPVQVIGSALFGEAALQGLNLKAILAGLVLHQAGPSLLWGTVFGLLAGHFRVESARGALGLGLAVGVVSMAGPYVLIPLVYQAMGYADIWNREVPMAWDWVAHLIFGASFVLYPAIARRLA